MIKNMSLDDSVEPRKKLAMKFFTECDSDHSGVVSIQEFLVWGEKDSFNQFAEAIGWKPAFDNAVLRSTCVTENSGMKEQVEARSMNL